MPDNLAGPESGKQLDLRKITTGSGQTERIELPSLPEKLATYDSAHHLEETALREEAPKNPLAPGGIVAASENRRRQEERYREIESALADGLEEVFLSMEPAAQQKFKQAGEEATRAISDLLEKGRSTARKIIEIIRKWLSLAPGINKFFLEQEAKIKTDKILEIQKKYV
jgi:hypothetical protein